MSHRPPPKISLRHDWTKELGSKVDRQPEGEIVRQPEGEVARQAKFFQPTQPIPNPIRDRSGKPGITQDVIVVQDERKTSRSEEISVNSFNEELCSSDRSGQPGITQDVISVQACSSEDSKSLNVEQTHDRSGQPGKDTVAVQDDPEVYHEAKTINILTIRQFVKELRQTWTSKFQDYHILLWSTRKVPAFENWFRKLRTTQIDMLFSETYDRVDHLIPSVQNQNKWFMKLETLNCVNCSRRNPKRSAKYVYHTGTLALSIKYTMDLLSIPDYVIKKGRPHGHRYGKKLGDKEYYIANQLKKKCKKRCFKRIHDRFIRDEQFRSRMIVNGRNENACRQMDALADEDHTHHLTSQEYFYYISNWWLRSTKTGSDTMPVQRRSDFKQALSTLQQLKEKEEEAQRNQRWAQSSSSSSWWSWQGSWVESLIPMKVTMEMNQVLIEQGDLLYKYLEQFFKAWFSWIHLLCYRWIVYSWRRSTVTDGGVNTTPQMTYFLGAKRVQNNYRLKLWWIVTSWQQDLNLDTKWKNQNYVRVGDKAQRECQWRHVCLRDTALHECQWRHPCLRGFTRCAHLQPHPLSTVHTFSGSLVIHLRTHMHLGSSLRHSSHLHIHVHVCGLFTLILLFYFLFYLPSLFLFLNYMKSMVNLRNSCNEGVDASDDLLLST